MPHEAEATIVVEVPVEVVYRAWSDFESFPRFMTGVERVRPLDASGTRHHWTGTGVQRPRGWDAEVTEITERATDQRIAWRSLIVPSQEHTVMLEPLGERTRVTLRRRFDDAPPADGGPRSGPIVPILAAERALREDLANFKQLVETGQSPRGGGWPWPVWAGLGLGAAALVAGTGYGVWYGLTHPRGAVDRARRLSARRPSGQAPGSANWSGRLGRLRRMARRVVKGLTSRSHQHPLEAAG